MASPLCHVRAAKTPGRSAFTLIERLVVIATDGLFLDGSVASVGLKQLWTLKWRLDFNTKGPWTKAGGVQPQDWPTWRRNFTDY